MTQKDYHKRKSIRGRVIIALHSVLGRRPTNDEIDAYTQAFYSTYVYSLKKPA